MLSAERARRDADPGQRVLLLPGALDVERIVARDLDSGTAARGVRFLGELIVQVAEAIPAGQRAAVALHFIRRHDQPCRVATCTDARIWLAESDSGTESVPLASA